MWYQIDFWKDGKPICWKVEQADNCDNAQMQAEFWVKIHAPNVKYDSIRVKEVER
jgi:hypothetical protein